MRLLGKRCLVTGAARGIGRAVARAFAQEGAEVIGVDRVQDELEMLVELGVQTHALELRDPEAIAALGAKIGRLDVLVNVAGIIVEKHLHDTTLEDWDSILEVNLRAPFLLCRAFVSAFIEQKSGAIINVSSRAGVMGFGNEIAYCASKFGLEGLSRAIADDLGQHGVAVNTITPGVPTQTHMSLQTYSDETKKIWKDPYLITPAFVFLALQTPSGVHNQYVNAWETSERLRAEGWATA
jgi:NAD(P)-dependent dehydrogenase (short-subunit alcohol dehydrogenase family)